MSFAKDIRRFVDKTGLRMDLVVRKLGFDILRGVFLRSPVDTGRFRGSWRIGINEVDTSVAPKEGGTFLVSLEAAGQKIRGAKYGQEINITNNLPYAKPLEDGHSPQAKGPNAIVGATVLEVKAKFRAAVSRIGAGFDIDGA